MADKILPHQNASTQEVQLFEKLFPSTHCLDIKQKYPIND